LNIHFSLSINWLFVVYVLPGRSFLIFSNGKPNFDLRQKSQKVVNQFDLQHSIESEPGKVFQFDSLASAAAASEGFLQHSFRQASQAGKARQ